MFGEVASGNRKNIDLKYNYFFCEVPLFSEGHDVESTVFFNPLSLKLITYNRASNIKKKTTEKPVII